MLVRLIPSDMPKYWKLIDEGLKYSVTSETYDMQEKGSWILKSIMVDRLVCWAALRNAKEKPIIEGFVITSVIQEMVIEERSLLIFALFSVPGVKSSAKVWQDGFDKLIKYAKSKDCKRIVFYTYNPKFTRIVRNFGPVEERIYATISI